MLLELGGKAPLVVLDDADLDAAVNAAAFGAFMNQGQICMSTERLVVDEKVADAFVARFAAKARRRCPWAIRATRARSCWALMVQRGGRRRAVADPAQDAQDKGRGRRAGAERQRP